MNYDDLAQLNGGVYTQGGGGVPPSIITDRWMNALTQSLINVIEAAGNEPDIDAPTLLRDSIAQLISTAIAGIPSVGAASTTASGVVELALQSEMNTGSSGTLVPPVNVVATYVANSIATAINNLIDGAPGALNTLNEIAAALQDNPDVISDILSAISLRLIASNNLSDLTNAGTARTNLSLGSMALRDVTISESEPPDTDTWDLWFVIES